MTVKQIGKIAIISTAIAFGTFFPKAMLYNEPVRTIKSEDITATWTAGFIAGAAAGATVTGLLAITFAARKKTKHIQQNIKKVNVIQS